jgi:hypothetical protein
MTTERFNVVLQGTTLRGDDIATVATELAKLIKRDTDFATHLLRGQPTKLKSGIDAASGARYIETLERIGVAVRLEAETLEVDADFSAPPKRADQNQTSRPANADTRAAERDQAESVAAHGEAAPIRDDARPALWAPKQLGAWVVICSMAFGAFLVARNWQALREPEKARAAWWWFAGSLLLIVIVSTFLNVFTALMAISYFLLWIFLSLVPQCKFVQTKFGKDFRRKPVVLAGVLTFLALVMAGSALKEYDRYLMKQASTRETAPAPGNHFAPTLAPSASAFVDPRDVPGSSVYEPPAAAAPSNPSAFDPNTARSDAGRLDPSQTSERGGRDGTAVPYNARGANQAATDPGPGDASAEFNLGNKYYDGHGVSQDYSEAATWYRKAAARGYAEAQLKLGTMYLTGKGVAKDPAEALTWYRKAADQGNADAQAWLGAWYKTSPAQDYTEAASWWRRAADQGNAFALVSLGGMYRDGQGVVQNYVHVAQPGCRPLSHTGSKSNRLCRREP